MTYEEFKNLKAEELQNDWHEWGFLQDYANYESFVFSMWHEFGNPEVK